MNAQPLVSVITPMFNGERYIKRCIESVAKQRYPVEHIIVDDCSSDGCWGIVNELAKKYSWIKVLRLEQNSGPIIARNAGISQATGKYLAFLDVDDFWLPEKLQMQTCFMQANNCALSFSDYRFVTEDGKKIGRRLKGLSKINWHLHHMTRYLGCLTIVLDRELCPNFQFPNISPEYRAEDFLAWAICIEKTGAALRCPHDLARYAVVPKSRSSNAKVVARSVWRLYRDIERLPVSQSAFYFLFYGIGVSWKRFWLQPRMNRQVIDTKFEWSILQ